MAKNATSSRKPSDVVGVDLQPDAVQPVAPVTADGNPPGPDAPKPAVPTQVSVIAREPIAELIDGEIQRFAKGDTFVLDEARAIALGPLVAIQPYVTKAA